MNGPKVWIVKSKEGPVQVFSGSQRALGAAVQEAFRTLGRAGFIEVEGKPSGTFYHILEGGNDCPDGRSREDRKIVRCYEAIVLD